MTLRSVPEDALSWISYSRFDLQPAKPEPPAAPATARYGDPLLDSIAPEMDLAYYRFAYAARLAPGDDPVRHYAETGWREGLNPTTWFDTRFYLDSYHDIRDAGLNPFFHYLSHGRREGRLARRPGGARRLLVEQASVPALRRPGYDAPANAPLLDGVLLGHLLTAACRAARALAVAVSHDCYIRVTGGMQVLISDEQALFNADRTAYLHVSPAIARLTLAGEDTAPAMLQVVLDGRFLGLIAAEAFLAGLGRADDGLPAARLFIVHSLFGHRAGDLARLAEALRPMHSFFWLHDYAALCEGFNLLRNDVAYCAAPPVDSVGCRICVYGGTRSGYLAALGGLFGRVPFHILAPGRAALDRFLLASTLPWLSARVHENLILERAPPGTTAGGAEGPVRVAFVGYAMAQKGWLDFVDLVRDAAGQGAYRFHHFGVPATLSPMDGVISVAARVDAGDRFAMVRALAEHAIDLVLVLSPWPETFSYVAHEAFAAGADVVALADSGNVADAVRRHGRGVVLADAPALRRFFLEGYAVDHVRQMRDAGRQPRGLARSGTTASVDLACLAPGGFGVLDDRPEAAAPDLALLAPGGIVTGVAAEGALRFALPARSGQVRLVSRREVDAGRGVAVRAVALDGVAVPLGDARLADGWLAPADGMRWTGGDATIEVGGARRLDIALVPGGRYRRLPVLAGG